MIGHRIVGNDRKLNASGEYEFSLTSETPIERMFGLEILDHGPEAVNMERLADGRHPLLLNHDPDQQVGVIRKSWLDAKSRMVRVSSDFSKATKAQEIKQDVEDNIRTLVSAGYFIDRVVEERRLENGDVQTREMSGDDFEQEMRALYGPSFYRSASKSDKKKESDVPTYRITRWMPFEASIVSIPADTTVGKGRSFESDLNHEVRMVRASHTARGAAIVEESMEEKDGNAAVAEPDKAAEVKVASTVLDEQRKANVAELEKNRKRAIENLCKANNLDEKYRDMWIGQGASLETVADEILDVLEERGKANPQSPAKIGMTKTEVKQFSLARAIKACADKDWKGAEFELDCVKEVARKMNRAPDPQKFLVPFEVLERPVVAVRDKRDLTVATVGDGGYLVSTDNQGFIEILRNRSVAFNMGVRRLSGLNGNVTVPRQTGAATPYWLANEASTATESKQAFTQMALSPKTVAAYTEISRLLLLQSSPSVEGIVTSDLAAVIAIAADLSVLNGSGAAGQPTGIIQTGGIGSVTGTTLAYAGILEFQTDVAASNVIPSAGGYVTTPIVAGKLMGRSRFSNTDTPLWVGNIWDGQMAGFHSMSSNQMPADAMLFGDWSEVVVGEWGVLEVEVNPYANFQAGIIGVRAMYSLDVGVRRPYAFSYASSIT